MSERYRCPSGRAWDSSFEIEAILRSAEKNCRYDRAEIVAPLVALVILPGWWKLLAVPLHLFFGLASSWGGYSCEEIPKLKQELEDFQWNRCTLPPSPQIQQVRL